MAESFYIYPSHFSTLVNANKSAAFPNLDHVATRRRLTTQKIDHANNINTFTFSNAKSHRSDAAYTMEPGEDVSLGPELDALIDELAELIPDNFVRQL